ncbi:SSS sodium solute transporter superfamily [[Leptolyngbya] sp. PCC 7376]|uniref:sodium:solute symporter n=1 Tax=[Leptolyngbya] sp. PCC 7376 TaxID=111781 RepID=UPI00029F44FA|nr:sodium:solute symporter [[Leptolyngbya] sp. PCC 7376]AFY38432.1 SSS sodium solute transporter superfamily [[Leptolyngbya] sp. PCC 7376]
MGTLDWLIVAIYGGIVIAIGLAASRKQSNTDEYFRGSRQLPWWAVGLSIIATSFSAASLLGGPGQGYNHGFLWLQLQLGDLLGYGLVIALFLPFFVGLNLTTAYEYLEKRFDAKTRSLGSFCFLLFVISRLGALLYGASLVVATVTGIPLAIAILIVGIVSIAYTVTGGITAVVWTDVLQFGMIFIGIGAGIWAAIHGVDGGFGALWQAAGEGDKLSVINLSWEPKNIYSLPTALFGYGIFAFAVAGTNQQSVQRYVSCADVPSARNAILVGWFSGFIGVAATLLLGVLLFGFYSLNTGLPEAVTGDKILPFFIVNQVPAGASGLLVAAIFAAAMSSIDSALHSVSTCMTVDFYDRYFAKNSKLDSLTVAKLLIVVWGILGILSAFYVASTEEDLLPFLVTYSAIFLGPLLGIFLMGVLLPRINANGAFYGTVVAVILIVIGTETEVLNNLGIWRSALTVPTAILLGYGISLFGGIPPRRSLKGLTLWTKEPEFKPIGRPGLGDDDDDEEYDY